MMINLHQKNIRGGKSFSVSVNQFVAEATKTAVDQQRPANALDVLAILVEKGQSKGIKLLKEQVLTREKIDQLRSLRVLQS